MRSGLDPRDLLRRGPGHHADRFTISVDRDAVHDLGGDAVQAQGDALAGQMSTDAQRMTGQPGAIG
jgi:hypothetical protein